MKQSLFDLMSFLQYIIPKLTNLRKKNHFKVQTTEIW